MSPKYLSQHDISGSDIWNAGKYVKSIPQVNQALWLNLGRQSARTYSQDLIRPIVWKKVSDFFFIYIIESLALFCFIIFLVLCLVAKCCVTICVSLDQKVQSKINYETCGFQYLKIREYSIVFVRILLIMTLNSLLAYLGILT